MNGQAAWLAPFQALRTVFDTSGQAQGILRESLRAFLRAESFVLLTPFDPISLPFSDEEPPKGDSEQAVLEAQEPAPARRPCKKPEWNV